MNRFEKILDQFHRIPYAERLERLAQWCDLDPQELAILQGKNALPIETAEHFIENVIGVFPLPMGVATYLNIDGRDVLVPMAVEETSIIAAVSATAKWLRRQGAVITTEARGRMIIGQIQIPRLEFGRATVDRLTLHTRELIDVANGVVPGLVARGGGIKSLEFREMPREDGNGQMLVIHVMCDPCDAMGANLINQVCEALKPEIEDLTGERVGLCILSNLVDGRMAYARVEIPGLDPELVDGLVEADQFARTDPYRAATHNKGVMNGIDPILIATGNDWRAVEAGVHAYCSQGGGYRPVTHWFELAGDAGVDNSNSEQGTKTIVGEFLAPLAVGTVGGVTQLHPVSRIALKILGVQHADELARICAATGLVQNLGAIRALATVGIVKGHMRLHASNLAIAAGASESEIAPLKNELTKLLEREKRINLSRAKEVLEELRRASLH